jgi:hypothetical protein
MNVNKNANITVVTESHLENTNYIVDPNLDKGGTYMSDLGTVETATDCTAPSVQDNYRAYFLQALLKNTPEVQNGSRDVFTVGETRGLFSQASDKALLVEQVKAWGERFKLTDPWLHEAATLTLHQWHSDPVAAGARRWAGLRNTPSQLITPAERQLKFEAQGWCVESEDWPEFERRATDTFKQQLKAYKAGLDAKLKEIGFRRAPKLREADHFRWLALYQVRGWSPAKIANDLSEKSGRVMTENGVLRAIKRKAKLISLTLRPSNKGKGKKTRTVARDRTPKFGFAYMT